MMSNLRLREWFNAIDVDRSGELDAAELQRALALGNLHFSLAVIAHMIRVHDPDRSGTISYAEFERLHTFLTSQMQHFQDLDMNKDGQLSSTEVMRALGQTGFQLDQAAFDALFRAFDPDRSGSLGLAEFIALSLFMQSAVATFSAFDPQKHGRVVFDFNQWVYAAANVI
eukprot:jgi/Botrbrau1/363/Bobra.110_2s0020.1